MVLICDSREQKNKHILDYFDSVGQEYVVSKLYCADYSRVDSMSVVIEKKRNLQELVGNICNGRRRFYDEIIRANKAGIKLIILCEHSSQIKTIQDVAEWNNPRLKKSPKAMTGRALMEELYSLHIKYGVEVLFCDKTHTGQRIIELLTG